MAHYPWEQDWWVACVFSRFPSNCEPVNLGKYSLTILPGRQEPESVLEHAIATLESNEPISAVVGLDYIIEYKNDLRMGENSHFDVHCAFLKFQKHRFWIICLDAQPSSSRQRGGSSCSRQARTKDDFTCDQIRQADQDNDKDELINEAAEKLEQEYGRGHVIVSLDSSVKDMLLEIFHSVRKSSFGNIYKAHLEHEKQEKCGICLKTVTQLMASATVFGGTVQPCPYCHDMDCHRWLAVREGVRRLVTVDIEPIRHTLYE
ncbi:hypothetical protein CEXT_167641 [Caerostris extrusa]|uniref:Uncharacterized protein n=1 Tax=Caerostris extrusa TaxID=172846 RepID=A0AAV4Y7A4_CAEEX|nr:hypothetical protein CEXT_167641 [Caerostris extrusa]